MPDKRPRRPDVSSRFGVQDDPWLGLPRSLRRLLRDRKVHPAHRIVLFEIIDRWRPERDTLVSVSTTTLEGETGLSRGYIHKAVKALAKHGLIGYCATQGKVAMFDLQPLIDATKGSVHPERQLRSPKEAALHPPVNTTASPRNGTASQPGSNVEPPETEKDPESARALAAADASPARPVVGEPDNGHGNGAPKPISAAEKRTVKDILDRLTASPAQRHPRAEGDETYAETNKRLADALTASEATSNGSKPTSASSEA